MKKKKKVKLLFLESFRVRFVVVVRISTGQPPHGMSSHFFEAQPQLVAV
jgi:hypothetical protein